MVDLSPGRMLLLARPSSILSLELVLRNGLQMRHRHHNIFVCPKIFVVASVVVTTKRDLLDSRCLRHHLFLCLKRRMQHSIEYNIYNLQSIRRRMPTIPTRSHSCFSSLLFSCLTLLLLLPSKIVMASSKPRVAIVTGGSRGIGRGIVEALAESGEYQGILMTYNSNVEAAHRVQEEMTASHPGITFETVGGDLTLMETRDKIFDCFDNSFKNSHLCLMVHNAGQYVGVTSENVNGLVQAQSGLSGGKVFGDGSLLTEDGKLDTSYVEYYQKLYSEAYMDLCERSLVRMKKAHEEDPEYRGSLIGISSPGCNHSFRTTAGYDMPGSGKCVMEFANRYYALRAAPFNINVNVVIPGVTRSDAWGKIAEQRGQDRESFLDQVKKMVPMEQVIEAKELGSVVAFLASKTGGGRFMTGLSLRVDGGLHLK